MVTEKAVQKAIKAMDAARDALEPLSVDDPGDSVTRLRSSLAEYSDYLEKATWWKRPAALSRSRTNG